MSPQEITNAGALVKSPAITLKQKIISHIDKRPSAALFANLVDKHLCLLIKPLQSGCRWLP
jgi:hypothetical protein